VNPGTNLSFRRQSSAPSGLIEQSVYGDPSTVDQSTRIPVLIFLASATLWLVVASLFWLLSSAQMYSPDAWWTFPGVSFLTFGRSYPLFLNSFVYGWASSAAIGVGIWLVSRLCRAKLRNAWVLNAAAALWNVGLLCGSLALLAGLTGGNELLEYPSYVAFILFLALAVISVWVVLTLWRRSPGTLSVSHWYLLTAFLCFPWAYATANLLLSGVAVAPGVSQPAIHWWYIGSLIGLWFTPICLSLAFYLIPKSVGRPLYSYKLALLGFWTLLLFAGWTGTSHLLGGPLPAWMITIGAVADILMLVPVIAVALNFHHTLGGKLGTMGADFPLRFVVIGMMTYTFYGAEGAIISTRTLGHVAEFTLVTLGHSLLGLFGFISMVFFGGFYYILPELLRKKWLFRSLIKIQFWLCIVGFGLWLAAVTIGGILQGFGLQDAKIPFLAISDILSPFLLIQNAMVLLIVVGNLGFAAAVAVIYLVPSRTREGSKIREFEGETTPEVTFS
jgi:cytochrome c oxidase cbb3-type subunit 1